MVPTSKGTALVTGAAKRIGKAVALHLAGLGYNIALHYNSSKAQAMATAKMISKKRRRCELFFCDLSDEHQTLDLVPLVQQKFPDLSVLINSASIFLPSQFSDQDLTLFHEHWNINFKAPYVLSCGFARSVRAGNIINLIDANVGQYKSRYADYLLTKKALYEFTLMAAEQFGPKVRVNGISPGMILPPVNDQKDDRFKRAPKIPMRKIGNPALITKTVQFLLDNEYITGQIIAVDGGEHLI
jgi:pteridine reductase